LLWPGLSSSSRHTIWEHLPERGWPLRGLRGERDIEQSGNLLYITFPRTLIKQNFLLDKQKIVLYSYAPFGHIAGQGCSWQC
jgi:hypothetical protein